MGKIEYVDETWNPVTGCTPISEGCEHCYARRMATRLKGRYGYPADEPFRVTVHEDKFDIPFKWRKSRRVFVCSMGDLFHVDVPRETTSRIYRTAVRNKRHQFLFLTKRPRNMSVFMPMPYFGVPPPNIWLGVTVEAQRYIDRVFKLLTIPAAVHWISLEPMLGPIDLSTFISRIDWVVVGGETGPGARPIHPDWVRKVRDDCIEADTPFFFKSWGTQRGGGRLLGGRTWEEAPE